MSNVINKTTMEIKYSVNTPDFPETEWVINPYLSLIGPYPLSHLTFDADFKLVLKSTEEIAAIEATELTNIKLQYLSIVNNAGEAYIIRGPGVEFPPGSGKYLSVSTNAQLKWMGWASVADQWELMGMSYPFTVRTIDDSDYISINNADEVRAVFGTMAQFIASVLGGSEVVKAAIQAATTEAEIIEATNTYLATVPTRFDE